MAIIEIELKNGQTKRVEFDGTPTQADIEEIANSLDNTMPEPITQNTVLKGGVEKSIDLTPSGLMKAPAKEIGKIPLEMEYLKNNGTLEGARDYATDKQKQLLEEFGEKHPIASKIVNDIPSFLLDTGAYSLVTPFKGANVLSVLGNNALQGGVIDTVESIKDKGLNLKENTKDFINGAKWGGAIGVGSHLGLKGLANGIESPAFQNKLANTIEYLTSVPKKYSIKALQEELKGKSILNNAFNEDTAYRPIGEKIRQAKSLIENKDYYNNEYYRLGQKAYEGMQKVYNNLTNKVDNSLKRLPTSENFAEQFNKLGKKAYDGFNEKQIKLEQKIREVLNKMEKSQNTLDIQNLRNSLKDTINSFANGGDINPALETAGREIKDVKRLLGIMTPEEKTSALNGLLKPVKEKAGFTDTFDREAESIALDLLGQQTGKDKGYLRMILKASQPQHAKQMQFESLMNEIETKPFDVLNVDGARYYSKFPELYQIMEDSTSNKDFMTNLASRVSGRNFKKYNYDNDPLASTIEESDKRFADIASKFIEDVQNPNVSELAYSNALNNFNKQFNSLDDTLKDEYLMDLTKLFDDTDNLLNPKVKAIDLHNIKELLYDKANYDISNSGIRNNALKAMANDINQTLRNANSEYAQANDTYKLLKDVEQAFGGAQGVNPNTIASKLMAYGDKGNILSNMDTRLRNLDAIVDTPNKFFLETKDLKKRMNWIESLRDETKSPNQQTRMNALRQLNELTYGGFYNDIKNINNFESLGDYNPLQGNIVNAKNIASKMRGYGSENNTLRGTDITLKDINSIVDNDYKFLDELQDLSNRHNEVKDILKEINARAYERHPKNLSNIQYTAGEEALDKLQKLSGINFMDDLEKTVSADALSRLFSGQYGGSGSDQGMANLYRKTLVSELSDLPFKLGLPLSVTLFSPKNMGANTIKNLGALYRLGNQEMPTWLIPLLFGTQKNLTSQKAQ